MRFPTFAAAQSLTHAFILRHWRKTCRFLFRFLARGIAVLVTLAVLSYAIMNWWGAGKRKESLARLDASGLPMTPADFEANQPPERENFAMIPLLKSATRQALELEAQNRRIVPSPENRRPDPGPELMLIRAMGDPALEHFARRSHRTGRTEDPDFSKLDKNAGYGLSAESFLGEYDRRNAPALEALREGLSRPLARVPLFTPGFEEDLQNASTSFYFNLRKAAEGLCLRADAALQTGDSDKAAESLVVALRLGEVAGSKGFFVSALLENAILTYTNVRLARGTHRHLWTERNLNDLESALVRMDLRGHVARSFEANTYYSRIWWSWSDRRPQEGSGAIADIWEDDHMPFWIAKLPSGWFDANGAIAVDRALEIARLTKIPGPLKQWTDAVKKSSAQKPKGFLSQVLADRFMGEEAILLRCVYMLVLRSQAVLACEIERTRIRTGSYPETLAAIATPLTIDPLFETPFQYRKDGESFQLYSFGPNGVDDKLAQKRGKNDSEFLKDDWAW